MKTPLVTVYITNYNYADFIRQSIESVLSQTQKDFELIIIDDGSKDHSKEIIESYRHLDFVTIIYQKNKGLNISNNVAMRAAKGKYIVRLDADDFLHETALEEMSKVLENDPSLGLVFPDYYYVDKGGEIIGEEKRHDFDGSVSLYDQPAHGACTMIRLSFLKKIGGYNESFTCQDGYDLWLKFITHYSVSNINKPLFFYRQHGQNLTTNEERILSTRRAIKETFIEGDRGDGKTLVVIPVRNTQIKGNSWPLFEVNGNSILSQKVETALESKTAGKVVIISEDIEILQYARSEFNGEPDVLIVERPSQFAGPNQNLGNTVKLALDEARKKGFNPEYVMTAALEFPFLEASVMDDLIHTILLFKTDAVLSVRPDNRMFYQHTGHTLSPILDQEKFTKLEREALYRGAGGIMASTIQNFEKHQQINSGKVGHVVVDEQMAFGMFSEFDFKLFCNFHQVAIPI